MPYLTSLAAIARGAGLRVVEQPGWQTRGHGTQTGVKTIICHHTGTTNTTANAPSLAVVQNGRSDLPGPLSHFVLGRDGTVFVIAAGQCWHAGATWQAAQSNAYAIGIEAEGTGYAAWPEVQMDAYARLCRALCAAFGLGVDRVQGHKEVCSPTGRKTDPNFDMGAFRARVANSGEDDDMTPDQSRKLDEIVQQLTGSREADKYPGWESLKFPGNFATLVDFIRAIDQNLLNLAVKVDEIAKAQQKPVGQ